MRATIAKDYRFAAAHHLEGLREEHKCARPHGHTYTVRLEVTGPVVEPGWVVDYAEFDPFFGWVKENLDHRDLNEALPVNPTAENISAHLSLVATKLVELPPDTFLRVGVSESPETWAWTTP